MRYSVRRKNSWITKIFDIIISLPSKKKLQQD